MSVLRVKFTVVHIPMDITRTTKLPKQKSLQTDQLYRHGLFLQTPQKHRYMMYVFDRTFECVFLIKPKIKGTYW